MTTGPMLTGDGFDRAAPHRGDADWLAQAWTRARILLISAKSSTPVRTGPDGAAQLAFVAAPEVPPDAVRRFLGVDEDVPYFAATVLPGADGWSTLRDVGMDLDDLQAGLVTTAIGLQQWHSRHPRCSICGAETVETQAGWTRNCPADGSTHFPRTDPAVIMLITAKLDGEDVALLGRGPQWGAGRFSTLAGFVEPGESLEAAVAREVFEEVGVRVTDVRYVASQPWPFPSSLMVGFSGRLDGDPSIHLDPVEMAEAGWFTRAEVQQAAGWADSGSGPDPEARLAAVSPKLSISRYLVDLWLADQLP
ncbi:MAG: NAD(+) diphosphatase [Jatrophihabitantaceae bacterium]